MTPRPQVMMKGELGVSGGRPLLLHLALETILAVDEQGLTS